LSAAAVNYRRVLKHRLDRNPAAILQALVKTAAPAGVTGDTAALLHLQQYDIIITVQADLPDQLLVA
jgi:hypothetical protein